MAETQRRADQMAAINRVVAAAARSLDADTTLRILLDAALDVTQAGAAYLSLVDENSGELTLRAQRGRKGDPVDEQAYIPPDASLLAQAIERDEVIVDSSAPERAGERVRTMILAPVHTRGRAVGVLSIVSDEARAFDESEIAFLSSMADLAGVALDHAQLREDVQEQAGHLRAVLASSSDAIITTDGRGYISMVNAAAEALFDLRVGEIVGMPLRHAPMHPRLREGLEDAQVVSDPGSSTVFEATLEDGRHLLVSVSPVRGGASASAAHESTGLVIVIRNVTHQHETDQIRIDFIHAAAHDLRNPLGVTLGALAMLQRDLGDVSELHREVIDLGIQGVNRMQELIDNVLNLEHIESGVGLRYKPVDVRELLERSIADIQPALQQREQTLYVDAPDALPPLMGDMHWLHRALLNLLSDANRSTAVGSEITLKAYVQDDALFIEVKDNGPGIPPEMQSHIFERFYRAPASDPRARGFGLGLVIVKSVVERHGGRVFVQSRADAGNTFGMVFPLSGAAQHGEADALD